MATTIPAYSLYFKNLKELISNTEYCEAVDKVTALLKDKETAIKGCQEAIGLINQNKVRPKEGFWSTLLKGILRYEQADECLKNIDTDMLKENIEETFMIANKLEKYLNDTKHEMANIAMFNYTIANAITIVSQFTVLKDIYTEFQQATNIIKDDEKFKKVEQLMY